MKRLLLNLVATGLAVMSCTSQSPTCNDRYVKFGESVQFSQTPYIQYTINSVEIFPVSGYDIDANFSLGENVQLLGQEGGVPGRERNNLRFFYTFAIEGNENRLHLRADMRNLTKDGLQIRWGSEDCF